MPRFPDYVAQEGLAVPSAPQIEANIAVGRSLNDFGQTLEEAGRRFAARQQQQADFDDQVAYQRRVGFDAWEVPDDFALADFQRALAEMTYVYQPSADGRKTILDLRRQN